jgi:two-component system phosphate regulon sensor histidine kinase PhoR
VTFAKNRFVQEVARNPDLQAFVRSTLASDIPVEGDVTWRAGEERFFQARGTSLRSASGTKTGSLIVLNEVTRLYRLERVRRDFVANVSHEMQTPITSIYGYAETLIDKDSRTDELTEKAAQAIVRQAGRLSLLVDDLLELSRIEKQAEAKEIPLSKGSVREVLVSAIETCRTASGDRGVSICLECPEDVQAEINPELLERAVVNLLDNATKYSERGKQVRLECEATLQEVLIRVRDEGCGISQEHLPRLFERFYRVDKARSRSLGGTGLGLAIVKHIVLAHRGTVSVQSEVAKGSAFTVVIPRPTSAA